MKIKKSSKILIDFALVVGGIALSVIGFLLWKEMGFQIEPHRPPNPHEGNARLVIVLIGIALTAYGVFDLIIFRKSKNDTNNEN